jgi:ABC-type uncharacterized transport system permease subunit
MSLNSPIITLTLSALALLSIIAGVRALLSLRNGDHPMVASITQRLIVVVITLTSLLLFILFWAESGTWQPVTSHRDGLVLMSCLLAATVLFIQSRPRLVGLSAFALPVLTFLLSWSVCASAWTYHPFNLPDLHPVWRGAHLAGVYMGTVCCGIATFAGGMYLYVQTRLKRKDDLGGLGGLASLETLEDLIIRSATLGFMLLTLGLVSGFIVISQDGPGLSTGWWITPKIFMSILAWLVYALLMNVRYASTFRGRRAAWLSVAGLLLLLGVYVAATLMPQIAASDQAPAATSEVAPAASTDQHMEDG